MNTLRLSRSTVRSALLLATITGLGIAGCSDNGLDLRPTLCPGVAGSNNNSNNAGNAPTNTAGTENQPVGNEGGDNAGGEGGSMPVGGKGGSGGKGGAGGAGGKGGAGGAGGSGGKGGSGGMSGGTSGPMCGDKNIDAGEECDDGNKVSGDGCSANCQSSCETCEKTVCPTMAIPAIDNYTLFYHMEGNPEHGPAAGTGVTRKQLAQELLKCVRQSQCAIVFKTSVGGTPETATATARVTLRGCACTLQANGAPDSVVPSCKNEEMIAKGPCLKEMREAAEADSLDEMWTRIINRNYVLGLATQLLQNCDARLCTKQCLPTEDLKCVTVDDAPGCSTYTP